MHHNDGMLTYQLMLKSGSPKHDSNGKLDSTNNTTSEKLCLKPGFKCKTVKISWS